MKNNRVWPESERGSLHGEVVVYPDVLNDLFDGAESMLSEPHGCFEQTSATTFPNVLALQFMKQSGKINPAIEKKALAYIRTGYGRLVSYEVRGGGFDWFGMAPAHEALTAYGLTEFIEMKKVFPDVDDAMIDRTRDWLLSRRNGDGTFKVKSTGFDAFGLNAGNVTFAYITYALSESGWTDLDTEYKYNLSEAWASKDMYQLGLMASTAYNLGRLTDYQLLVRYFESQLGQLDAGKFASSKSVVSSQGISLNIDRKSVV